MVERPVKPSDLRAAPGDSGGRNRTEGGGAMSERDFELASARAEQERDAAIAAAYQAFEHDGLAECPCGEPISDKRRIEFKAIRCLECQKDFEQEKYHR